MTMDKPFKRSEVVQDPHVLSGAYFWLLAFFVVYCARPEDWIPGLHGVPLAKITGVFALVGFVFSAGQTRRLPREMLYWALLFVQLWLTVPFSPVWRGGAFNQVLDFSKVGLIVPVIVLTVTSLARLRRLIFVQVTSVAVIAVVSLVKGHLNQNRLEGVLGGIYSNPNDLALAIVLSLPYCLAFMLSERSHTPRKAAWLVAMVVMTYTLFLTDSRGGLIALLAGTAVLMRDFGVRGGRRYLLVGGAAVLLTFFLVAGAGLRQRFDAMFGGTSASLQDLGAYESAVQRRELLWKSVIVTAEHPLFGVGPGNFAVVSGNWHVAHNSFTEFSAEAGLPALILFLLLIGRSWVNVRDAGRLAQQRSEEILLTGALRASLVGFVVGAFFGSLEYDFFPYFLVAYAIALHGIAVKQAARQSEDSPVPADARREQLDEAARAVTWSDYRKGRTLATTYGRGRG